MMRKMKIADLKSSSRFSDISGKVAFQYSLSSEERDEMNQLLEGLVLHLLSETDSLVPAFMITDVDISIYEAKYSQGENGMVEECPSGYEVNDYKVDFVRNPENHEIVVSYGQLIDKMKKRQYDWNWQDLKSSERDGIRGCVKEFFKNHDWVDIGKTYVYDEDYTDAIVTEGKSKVKMGVKTGEEYFTVFVLRARPSDEPIEQAVDAIADRWYKMNSVKK